MARVTVAEVKNIIDIDSSISDTDLGIFITAANALVTAVCTSDILTDELLKEIERWLSAHFIAIRDMRSDTEKAGDVSVSYQYRVGLRLDCTMYGQQALALDISGALAAQSAGKVAPSITFIGGERTVT